MQMPIYMDGGGGCRLCYTLIHAVFIGLPHNSRVATLLGGSNDAGSDSINGVTPRVRVRIRRTYMSVPQAVRAWERYIRSTPAPPGGPGDIPDFSAWMYNPRGFHQIQLFSFQSVGEVAEVDAFGDVHNLHEGLNSFRTGDLCGPQARVLWVNGDWADYPELIPMLLKVPGARMLILSPVRPQEAWFRKLQSVASHIYHVPCEADTFLPQSTDYKRGLGVYLGEVAVYWVGFLEPTGATWAWQKSATCPKLEDCSTAPIPNPRYQKEPWPVLNTNQVKLLKPPQAFNVDAFVLLSKYVTNRPLYLYVLSCIADGGSWPLGMMGRRQDHLDFSSPNPPNVEQRLYDQYEEYVEEGYMEVFGGRPPFPNPHDPEAQAHITNDFAIPKDKYQAESVEDSDRIRPVAHRSFPKRQSHNDRTLRMDSGEPYYTAMDFAMKVVMCARLCWMWFMDVPSAYKLLIVRAADWHQQVYKCRGWYFVDKTCVFGSVAAADHWNCFITCVMDIVSNLLRTHSINAFVDNIDCVVSSREVSWRLFSLARKVFEFLGIPIHELVGPTQCIESHLGWGYDTIAWVIFVPKVKRKFLLDFFQKWHLKHSCTLKELEQLVGLFQWLAVVFRAIRPALKRAYAQIARSRASASPRARFSAPFKVKMYIKSAVSWTRYVLGKWDFRFPLDCAFGKNATCTIFLDAGLREVQHSAQVWGRGAYCTTRKLFYAAVWKKSILNRAMREEKWSSTYVEVFNVGTAIATLVEPGSRVHVVTDSQAGFFALTKHFSKCMHITAVIHAIDAYCLLNNIVIVSVQWVRRKFNSGADMLSHGDIQGFRAKVKDGFSFQEVQPLDLIPFDLWFEPSS